jgi:predicted DCC family thiol-disulfide oxidoreductase YuxK
MAGPSDHAILYDADCGFCTRMLDRIMRRDRRGRLRAVPIQAEEGQRLLCKMPAARRLDSWHLVLPDGEVVSGGAAGPPLLRLLPGGALPAALLATFPAVTEVGYRWIANHREQLGRLSGLVLALVVVGCGSAVQEDSELTVYLSAPLRGAEAGDGRDAAAGARQALERAGGEAGGVGVTLEVLDDTERSPAPGGPGWTQARVAANARTATEDSTSIAYLGELSSDATRASAPITNDAGVVQVSPGPVEPELLAEPGGNGVPDLFQPSGERTLVALLDPADAPPSGRRGYRGYGFEAMALVLDAIGRAEDPLSRADVTAAVLATADRDSELGTYSIDPRGLASFAGS